MRKKVRELLQDPKNQKLLNHHNFKQLLAICFGDEDFPATKELIEILKSSGFKIEDKDIPEGYKFINSIIGKKVKLTHIESSLWEDDPRDKQTFTRLLGSIGEVKNCSLAYYDPSKNYKENFNNGYWDIELDGNLYEGIYGGYFTLLN